MSAVLYDLPGPRAKARNRITGVLSTVAIVALVGYVGYRFWLTGQFESTKWLQFQYVAIQRELLAGLGATLSAAGLATVLALVFGAVFASARISDHAFFRAPAAAVVELFRAIPLLILMFFGYYGARELGFQVSAFWPVVVGLMLYNGSVLAEIFRAGILAVPKGQAEAAYALGMRKTQVVTLILLPQAVRSMLPSIVSQLVVLLKDTALGFIVTYPELLYVAKQMGSRLTFDFPYVPTFMVVAVVYIGMCAILSWFAGWLEGRTRRKGGRVLPTDVDADLAVEKAKLQQMKGDGGSAQGAGGV